MFQHDYCGNNNDSGTGSLRQAINDLCSGGTITFDSGLSGQTITLTTGEISISKSLTIDGSGLASHVRISGNNSSRVFNITSGNTLTLTHLDIINGSDGNNGGGGIKNDGTLNINYCTFSGHSSGPGFSGGGILNSSGTLMVNNSTFSGNSAGSSGGGIRRAGGTFILKNTILANNGGKDCSGAPTTALNNLIEASGTNACGLTNGTNGNIIGSDPNLGALADNGGKTHTFTLLTGSPAINAGDANSCLTTDQIDQARVGICDIGAYESQIIPITAGVSITGVSNVKATTALAAGTASGTGITERGFFWWNDTQYWGPKASGLIPAGYGAGDFSLTLSNLPMKTQLYVSAYIKAGGQTITAGPGNFITITTTDPMIPTVITEPDFTVSGNGVLAKGEITDVGSSAVTIYGCTPLPQSGIWLFRSHGT